MLGHGPAGGIGVASENRRDDLGVLVLGMLDIARQQRNRVKELIEAALTSAIAEVRDGEPTASAMARCSRESVAAEVLEAHLAGLVQALPQVAPVLVAECAQGGRLGRAHLQHVAHGDVV